MAKKQKSKRSLFITIITVLILMALYYFEDKQNNSTDSPQVNTNEAAEFSDMRFSKDNDTTRLIVMFYNLENFFDTIDDPHNRYDNEYVPDGEKHWNTKRYMTKIKNLGQVFLNVDPSEVPDLIGVCEVENKRVLEDLVNNTALKGYKIVHYESKDMRGIDLALLYDPTEFKVLSSEKIDIHYKPGRVARTREIIHIVGQSRNGETLHIFLNHWKSRVARRAGEQSEYKRIAAAKDLKKAVAKVLKQNPDAKIIIMGDFNDEPTNKSLYSALGAKEEPARTTDLYNVMLPLDKQGKGTYFHDHQWLMFDNIILSGNFILDSSKLIPQGHGRVLEKDFLFKENRKKEKYPFRTFAGSRYLGGYSDHLPVYEIFDVRY